MRVNLVVVGEPGWQLTHDGLGIGSRTDAEIVAFDRTDEGFSHSIALGLSMGVVLGSRPMSRAKLRVLPAVWQLPLSDSHSMVVGP